jgi:Glycosyl transferase family 2
MHRQANIAASLKRVPCQILLSSYNGAQYLPQFLSSIAAQERCLTGVLRHDQQQSLAGHNAAAGPILSEAENQLDLELLWRDDGSQDTSPALIRAAPLMHRPLLAQDQAGAVRLGAAGSFFALLAASRADAYLAFADQDDVWHQDKMARAVAVILQLEARMGAGVPILYCARACRINSRGMPLGLTPMARRGPGFANALIENIALGCTIVLNPAARALLLSVPLPPPSLAIGQKGAPIWHDWWCYLVVSAFGHVVYDPRPVIDYRQHGGNLVGAAGPLRRGIKSLGRMSSLRQTVCGQAGYFAKVFGPRLTTGQQQLVNGLLLPYSRYRRLQKIFTNWPYYRQDKLRDYAWRICYWLFA